MLRVEKMRAEGRAAVGDDHPAPGVRGQPGHRARRPSRAWSAASTRRSACSARASWSRSTAPSWSPATSARPRSRPPRSWPRRPAACCSSTRRTAWPATSTARRRSTPWSRRWRTAATTWSSSSPATPARWWASSRRTRVWRAASARPSSSPTTPTTSCRRSSRRWPAAADYDLGRRLPRTLRRPARRHAARARPSATPASPATCSRRRSGGRRGGCARWPNRPSTQLRGLTADDLGDDPAPPITDEPGARDRPGRTPGRRCWTSSTARTGRSAERGAARVSQTSSATAPRTARPRPPQPGPAAVRRARAAHRRRWARCRPRSRTPVGDTPARLRRLRDRGGRQRCRPRRPRHDGDGPAHPDAAAGRRTTSSSSSGCRRSRPTCSSPTRTPRTPSSSAGSSRRSAGPRTTTRSPRSPGWCRRPAQAQPADADALAALNAHVLDYAGLVEAARANNRQGLPVGAQYLREASNGLRADALPVADALVEANTARADRLADHRLGLGAAAARAGRRRRLRRGPGPGRAAVPAPGQPRPAHRLARAARAVPRLARRARARWRRRSRRRAATSTTSATSAPPRVQANLAKSSESLTLIARGSGQAYEDVLAGLGRHGDRPALGRPRRAPTFTGQWQRLRRRSTPRSAASTTAARGTTPSRWRWARTPGSSNAAFAPFDHAVASFVAGTGSGAVDDLRGHHAGPRARLRADLPGRSRRRPGPAAAGIAARLKEYR